MESVKNRDRRKLFQCLKPPTINYEPIAAPPPPPLPPLSFDQYQCGRNNNIKNKNKKKARQSLSGGLKAVLVKSFLGKKFRKKKSRKDETFLNTMKKNSSYTQISDIDEVFTNSSLSNTTSTRSSISSHSGSERMTGLLYLDSKEFNTNNTKQESTLEKAGNEISKCVCNPIRIGMFMFVVCLFALVFGGKPLAILTCTSLWLFFAPCRWSKQGPDLLENEVIELGECKKKVVMDGLLGSNQRPRIS